MSSRLAEGVTPPEFLQIAGHPLRWRLLRELARSDRTVQELTALAGEAQNLVSYHLGKLRKVGLVSGHRSSADGRDTYYAADLARFGELLSSTAAAIHPGLGPASAGTGARRTAARVLFLCTGNSARSQMAEAILRHRALGTVEVCSAGSHPKPLHPHAIRVMRATYGLDLTGQEPKHLSAFADQHFDWVITLCDRVREVCPEFPGGPQTIHWSIPDPAAGAGGAAGDFGAFRRTAAELEDRIGFLLAVLDTRIPTP